MEYYSAIKKNSFESVLMRWMKLAPIIQSEVSQKDRESAYSFEESEGISVSSIPGKNFPDRKQPEQIPKAEVSLVSATGPEPGKGRIVGKEG